LALAAAVLAVGCGGTAAKDKVITVGGDKVTPARLVDASAGLCEAKAAAGSDPEKARATFYDRSHSALHTVARGLEPVDRALATQLLEAKGKVEAELEAIPPKPSPADLGALDDVYRAGLGRLAITAPPCVE
jgi:hypothetical protein